MSDDGVYEAAQSADLDAVAADLALEAQLWGRRIRRCQDLQSRTQQASSDDRRFLVMEVAGSWQIGQLTAARWLEEAERFTTCLPRTLERLECGTLHVHQAKVLLHRTRHCDEAVARAVEVEVLPVAAELCPSDLGRRVDEAVLRIEHELDEAAAEQRHADAAADRHVFARPEADGMAAVGALLTAEQQVAFSTGLDALERRERIADRAAGVDRTAQQRRADLFAALPAMVLAGTAQEQAPGVPWTLGPEQLAATVVLNVHVPVSTVLDMSHEPGRLEGYGPLGATHVRLLRPAACRRVMVDQRSGRPIAVDDRATRLQTEQDALRRHVQTMLRPAVVVDADEPQHDPSARLARLVDIRDVRCAGPGCASSITDRDHLDPYPQGPTSARNLSRLSRRCHGAKHAGWHLERHEDGSVTWRSPLGRTYRRPGPHRPPRLVDVYGEPPPPRPPAVGRPAMTVDEPDEPPPTTAPDPLPSAPEPDEPPF